MSSQPAEGKKNQTMHFSHNVKGLFEGEDLVLQLGPGLGLKSDLEATSGEA